MKFKFLMFVMVLLFVVPAVANTTPENKTVRQKIAAFCKKRPGLLLLGATVGLMAAGAGLLIYAINRSQSNTRVFDSNNKEIWNSSQPFEVLIEVLPSGPFGSDSLR